jgi:tRNA (guanine-N7-)-methyltransferase
VSVRKRQHVNPLHAGYQSFRGQRPELAAGRPVELEIGCAEAQFLFERAALDPSRTYVGLEIREVLVNDVNQRAARVGAPVQAVFCHAGHHLETVLAPGSVARVYVNFPDPWFKRRHHKRRLMDGELARSIHAVLAVGGELLFQSDVWAIALDAMAVLDAADDRFVNQAGAWSFWKEGNPYGVRSWREQHCEEAGLPIWRLLYRTS